MDAVKYLKEEARMLKTEQDTGVCGIRCNECPFFKGITGEKLDYCEQFKIKYPQKAVEIVEKWAAEHPKKTRQSEFLKMFPNAKFFDEEKLLSYYPCDMDTRISFKNEMCKAFEVDCCMCRKEYWSQEVDDGGKQRQTEKNK